MKIGLSRLGRSWFALAGALCVLVSLLTQPAASAAPFASPVRIDEYRLPPPDDSPGYKGCHSDMVAGSAGMWYSRTDCTYPDDPAIPEGRIGVVAPNGTIRETVLPGQLSPEFIAPDAGDGNIWFTYYDRAKTRSFGFCTGSDSYAVVTRKSEPSPGTCSTSTASPYYGIARLNPATMAIDYYGLPQMDNSMFFDIETGPDGNLYWVTTTHISVFDCSANGWNVSTDPANPRPNGWIETGYVYKLDPRTFPSTRSAQTFEVQRGGAQTFNPQWNNLEFAPDGTLWFGNKGKNLTDSPPCTDTRRHEADGTPKPGAASSPSWQEPWHGGQMFRFNPATGVTTKLYDVYGRGAADASSPPVGHYGGLIRGSDGNMWIPGVNEGSSDRGITRFTPAGVATPFVLWPSPATVVFVDMATGSDGQLWMPYGNNIARYNIATGVVEEAPNPSSTLSSKVEPAVAPALAWYAAGGSGHINVVRPTTFAPQVSARAVDSTVGQTVPVRWVVNNPGSTDGAVITNAELVPSCATRAASDCPGVETGVYQLAATGTGEADGANPVPPSCLGTWAVAPISPGRYRLTPPGGEGSLVVAPNAVCAVRVDAVVQRTPTTDSDPAAGTQTHTMGYGDARRQSGGPSARTGGGAPSTISPLPNQAPFVNDDLAITLMNNPITIPVLANDSDPDADPADPTGGMNVASVARISGPTSGTATVNAGGTITYRPNPGFWGNDSFDYRACDRGAPALCDTGTVTVEVTTDTISATGRMPS